jgi:hypothetical protein
MQFITEHSINGYELRKATFPEQEEPKKIELSFKELYEAMNAIDNIGWGFSKEGNGLYLRVERWQWFYKNEVIMTIHNPGLCIYPKSQKKQKTKTNIKKEIKSLKTSIFTEIIISQKMIFTFTCFVLFMYFFVTDLLFITKIFCYFATGNNK